jgi:hypothetical protein
MSAARKLLTTEEHQRLLANALADGTDHIPVVKLFTPDAQATWLISECDPDDPDRVFALCDLGLGIPELGFISLTEIAALRGNLGLAVEKDLHFTPERSILAYAREARQLGRIVA